MVSGAFVREVGCVEVCERENHEFREWARMVSRTGAFGVFWRGGLFGNETDLYGARNGVRQHSLLENPLSSAKNVCGNP